MKLEGCINIKDPERFKARLMDFLAENGVGCPFDNPSKIFIYWSNDALGLNASVTFTTGSADGEKKK
jgi:hypothetical protein